MRCPCRLELAAIALSAALASALQSHAQLWRQAQQSIALVAGAHYASAALLASQPTAASKRSALVKMEGAAPTVGTLYDVPVSNNGARCRMILYYKDVGADEVALVTPHQLGGLKSAEYLRLNPHGLMPLLTLATGESLPESDTIARYLCAKFSDRSPVDLSPSDPLRAALCDRICRLHDVYITSIQGCLYKQTNANAPHPFGRFPSRRAALDNLIHQLRLLEQYADQDGPYLLGKEPSTADCAVFPTAIFWMHMLPKFGYDTGACMGPRLTRWWSQMTTQDKVGERVHGEMMAALQGWDSNGRWDTIRGAGLRDEAPPTLFDKILAGSIPADVVYEDDVVLAFRDIAPVAPTHVLLIPKTRDGLTQLKHATVEHRAVLGHMLAVAVPAIVAKEELSSYRLVVNDGEASCQSVFHLHMHIIGGKQLTWPPGA